MPSKAQSVIESATELAADAGMHLDAAEATGEEIADERFEGSALGRAAQIQTVISVVAIGVVAIVGILIYSQVEQSMATPEQEGLANASNSVTDGFGNAMELVPTVLIVLVAALVIGVIQRLRG